MAQITNLFSLVIWKALGHERVLYFDISMTLYSTVLKILMQVFPY